MQLRAAGQAWTHSLMAKGAFLGSAEMPTAERGIDIGGQSGSRAT